jgi:heat shock protein HspQ
MGYALAHITEVFRVSDCKYQPGQIIYHRGQGYRGVVYDVDPSCQATDEWYKSNKTQPARNQPWYHVLVDNEEHTTYVAEENIATDVRTDPINHPLIEQYFIDYADGQYRRGLDA